MLAQNPTLPGSITSGKLHSAVHRDNVRRIAQTLCGWGRDTFPGSQPVSITRAHLDNMSRERYVVCEKTDGERFLLLVEKGEVFLYNRKEDVFKINMAIPTSRDGRPHSRTLLDGELVPDTINGATVWTFYIYDLITCNDVNFREQNLIRRLEQVVLEILLPKKDHFNRNAEIMQRNPDPFVLRLKQMYNAWDAEHVFTNVVPTLPHECDGLIYTPVDLAYIPGTCDRLIKWKPTNTVDFHVKVLERDNETGYFLEASENGMLIMYEFYNHTPEEHARFAQGRNINGRIVECEWDPHGWRNVPDLSARGFSTVKDRLPGCWRITKVREDRQLPNDIRIVKRIMQSIEDGVDMNALKGLFHNQKRDHLSKVRRQIEESRFARSRQVQAAGPPLPQPPPPASLPSSAPQSQPGANKRPAPEPTESTSSSSSSTVVSYPPPPQTDEVEPDIYGAASKRRHLEP